MTSYGSRAFRNGEAPRKDRYTIPLDAGSHSRMDGVDVLTHPVLGLATRDHEKGS